MIIVLPSPRNFYVIPKRGLDPLLITRLKRTLCTRGTAAAVARPYYRKPFRAVPIKIGQVYRHREVVRRRVSRMKVSGLFCAVVIGVFALGMLITHLDEVAIPGAAWTRVPGATSTCAYLSVHDGDTISCGTERIRLLGIDAPELTGSPRCEDERAARSWCDDELARRSREALRGFLSSGRVAVAREGKDKYGRTLAVVRVDGRDAGDYLTQLGLAKRYR